MAISLLAIIGVGFLAALGTSARALLIADERETAKNISEMQMEYVKASSWTWGTYPQHPDIADAYPGYVAEAIPAPIESRDANIQKITVTVRRNGREIFSITGYKEKPEG